MPRVLFLSAALFASAPTALAQFDVVDLAWSRSLQPATYGGQHPIEIEAAPDGGFVTLSLERALPLNNFDLRAEVVVRKFDENGDAQWASTIDSPPVIADYYPAGRFADAAVGDQGDVYVIVARPTSSLLRRYSPAGTLVWEVDLPLVSSPIDPNEWRFYHAAFVKLAPSGDVIVGGLADTNSYPRGDVRAFSPDGVLRWQWQGEPAGAFGTTAHIFPSGMAVGPDGNIYLYGRSDQPNYQHGPHVLALSPVGSFLWRDWILGGGTPVAAVEFDSQDRVVALVGYPDYAVSETRIVKYAHDGSKLFSTGLVSPPLAASAASLRIDSFDRIYVGGSSRPSFGPPGTASLFRFDAAGAFAGASTPSTVGLGESGSLDELLITPRNDVVAMGTSGDGPDGVILTRFSPDGSERWSERRPGMRPLTSRSRSVRLGLAADPRGNVATLVQSIDSGTFPNQVLGVVASKYVQNGPAGAPFCCPAVPNSTGLPAALRGLGPSLASANNVTLLASELPSGAVTLFLGSRTQGNVPNVGGGQGTLCLGGSIGRFFGPGQVRVAGQEGSAALQLDLTALPQPNGSVVGTAGESWSFQAWYRDANPSPTSNLTGGVAVALQ